MTLRIKYIYIYVYVYTPELRVFRAIRGSHLVNKHLSKIKTLCLSFRKMFDKIAFKHLIDEDLIVLYSKLKWKPNKTFLYLNTYCFIRL